MRLYKVISTIQEPYHKEEYTFYTSEFETILTRLKSYTFRFKVVVKALDFDDSLHPEVWLTAQELEAINVITRNS